jgi:hypothetical protein
MVKDSLESLGGVAGFRHYFNIGFILEQAPEALAQQDMVVHQ